MIRRKEKRALEKTRTAFLIGICFFSLSTTAGNPWKSLPVQDQGRIKPFDTLAREVLFKVHGGETFGGSSFSSLVQGKSALRKKEAVDVLLSWMLIPSFWEKTPFIFLENKAVKKSLGLSRDRSHFSPEELKANPKIPLQFAELKALRQKKAPLDDYFNSLEKLETRWTLYELVKSGALLRIQPQKGNDLWKSLSDLTSPAQKEFQKALSAYVRWISALSEEGRSKTTLLRETRDSREKEELSAALKEFQSEAFRGFQNKAQPLKIRAEILLNDIKPFRIAWILYLLFLTGCVFALMIWKRSGIFPLFPLCGLGLFSHFSGLVLRSYIMSRPPVTNMYETVVWVPFTALLAGVIFYWRKSIPPFIASVILAFFCLLLTDMSPEILDNSLQPLEAVLRSTFWLSTHVLIITMSYAFFCLAFVLGDIALFRLLFSKKFSRGMVEATARSIYRSLQWGVVLLTGGTLLGAIWADYSWGRFWGWDPKESWALISLLGYLALLHGRWTGWIRPLGFVIGSVLMFFLVLMAWYGVNFILGKGLHSYGFGAGGQEFVAGFFVFHVILCLLAFFKSRSALW